MSGSMNPMPSIDELRRRFAIWSLAIFGSLSGSGSVRLESTAWGAEDPPTEAKTQSDSKSQEESKSKPFDRAVFQQLVQDKDFEAAAKMIDEGLAQQSSGASQYMNFMLANAMINAKDPAGLARMETVAKQTAEALDGSASQQTNVAFAMSHYAIASKLASEKKYSEAIDIAKLALQKMEDKKISGNDASLSGMLMALLMREGRAEEGKAWASKRLEASLAAAKENSNTANRSLLASSFSQFGSVIGNKFPEELQKAYDTIEPMLREALESESAGLGDYSAYQTVQTSLAMSKAETDGAAAMKLLEDAKAIGDKLAERLDESEQKRLAALQRSLKQAESRIQSKMLHQSLIGQHAPEFDIEAVVNMPEVSWADLKGKVVLIDFWAVWCGPCIATFPHLQEWKKQYGDKGLVIVGVTRQYGYKWDEEQGRQVSDPGASMETELAMLEEFRKAHKLEHGFVVTPKQSDYNSKFGVTGIPQAVLVDQNGVIQLIKVGSGEKNAEDLEAKIKSLLGV